MEKITNELENVLGKTHLGEFDKYCSEHKEELLSEQNSFEVYIKELLRKKGMTQKELFARADLPERYGYKLLSGEKKTRQRDVIVRICYAAELTLDETQRALEEYEMPRLYPRIARDAFLMIAFNERPGGIEKVNALLEEHGMEALKASGIQET